MRLFRANSSLVGGFELILNTSEGPLIKKEIATHEDVDLLKVDVDEFDEIAMHYEVRAMPTVIFVKNGEEIDRFVGFRQGAVLTNFIEKNK